MSDTALTADKKSIVIDGATYSIVAIPEATSKLVVDTKTRVLGELKLDDLLSNLKLVGQMLFVAYNGVASEPKLRGQISTLQVNYMSLCGKSQQAMESFDANCEAMLRNLKNLFTYLLAGEEDTALLYIGYMAKVARDMAATATTLKDGFDALFLDATVALAGAETAKGTEEERKKALEKERQNYEALTAKAQTLKDEIAKSKVKLQELYEEAKAAAEKHENRAFALAMVGAIMKPLGDGLGAFAGAMASSKIPISLPTQAPAPKDDKTDPKPDPAIAAKKKEVEEAEEKMKSTKAAAEKAEGESKDAKKKAKESNGKLEKAEKKLKAVLAKKSGDEGEDEKEKEKDTDSDSDGDGTEFLSTLKDSDVEPEPDDDSETKSAKSEAKEAKAEAKQAKEKADAAEGTAKTAKEEAEAAAEKYKLLYAALAGVGAALSSGGAAAIQMGKDYSEIAAAYNKEKQEYLKRLLDEQKAERDALASIAEYAKRMKNLGSAVEVAKLVIEALHQAIGALKQIVVILSTAADLWKRMAQHCTDLSTGSETFKDRIELWKAKPNRIDLYLGTTFVEDAVRHYADWKALQVISKDYAAAASKVKAGVQTNVKKNVTSEEMLKLAISEGKNLFQETNENLNKVDKEGQAIEEELKNLKSADAGAMPPPPPPPAPQPAARA